MTPDVYRKGIETKKRTGVMIGAGKKAWETRKKNGTDTWKQPLDAWRKSIATKIKNGTNHYGGKSWKTRQRNKLLNSTPL
jgi:hypothetical protein